MLNRLKRCKNPRKMNRYFARRSLRRALGTVAGSAAETSVSGLADRIAN